MITILFLSTFATLGILNFFGTEFHLYWRYTWLDMPAHFLGGATVAFGMILFRAVMKIQGLTIKYRPIIFTVFAIGVLWEFFEIAVGATTMHENGYFFDTFTDLFMDCIGGSVGYVVIRSLRHL